MNNDVINVLKKYTVEKLTPIIGAKTIQLLVFREILDFSIFRTEESRELNTVVTPRSIKEANETEQRVAFFASKQKAVESRTLEHMLRTAGEEVEDKSIDKKIKEIIDLQKNCYLKSNLCLNCPRCVLFGGTNTESGQEKEPNIKHRIEYSTAFSLLPAGDIEISVTFNAIDDREQSTGQALGSRNAVRPATIFPSIVTIKSGTLEEVVLTIKTLLSAKSYGAETRIGGDVRNTIVGIVAGWEEVITSLEFVLELSNDQDDLTPEKVVSIVEKYKEYTGNPARVYVFSPEEVESIVEYASSQELSAEFLTSIYSRVLEYRDIQKKKKA